MPWLVWSSLPTHFADAPNQPYAGLHAVPWLVWSSLPIHYADAPNQPYAGLHTVPWPVTAADTLCRRPGAARHVRRGPPSGAPLLVSPSSCTSLCGLTRHRHCTQRVPFPHQVSQTESQAMCLHGAAEAVHRHQHHVRSRVTARCRTVRCGRDRSTMCHHHSRSTAAVPKTTTMYHHRRCCPTMPTIGCCWSRCRRRRHRSASSSWVRCGCRCRCP